VRYVNSFHSPRSLDPAVYSTDAEPVEYRGLLIVNRIKSTSARCFDVVKDGICIGQYAGPRGAREFVDTLLDRPRDFWAVRAMSKLEDARASYYAAKRAGLL